MKAPNWKNPAARAAWIYYQLRLRQTTAAALGRRMKPPASKRVLSYVINGQAMLGEALTRRVQEGVANVLGLGWEELWGEVALKEAPQRRAG